VRRHAAAARSRLAAAHEVTGPTSLAGAFALLREAAALAGSAVAAARAGDADDSSEATTLSPRLAHERLLALTDAAAIPALPSALVDVARALSSDDPLSADNVPKELLASAKAYVSWLLDLVEVRTARELEVQRGLRLTLLGAGLLLSVALVLALLFSAKNLAEGRRVTASSLHTGFDTRAIVDGRRSGTPGYESNLEPNPWIQIDLGDHFQLESIRVTERNERRGTGKLVLQISDDGTSWKTVGSTRAAQPEGIWRVNLSRPWARYVKVSLEARGSLSLAEVEIYGK
jgi:hypothetical protein